jgi:hypothetical protein
MQLTNYSTSLGEVLLSQKQTKQNKTIKTSWKSVCLSGISYSISGTVISSPRFTYPL